MIPPVSVIIPVYNAQAYLKELLSSLSAQRFRDFEVIFVDDGSTDDSAAILEEACRDDDRFHVLHEENRGKYIARSKGLTQAAGAYIAFLDSDDLYEPDYLKKLYETAETTNADIVICGYVRQDTDTGRICAREMIHFPKDSCTFPKAYDILPMVNSALWNKLFRKELLSHAIHFETPSAIAEDMMFCASLYPYANRIAFVPEVLCRYRIHKGSAMSGLNEEQMELIRKNMILTREYVLRENDTRQLRDFLSSTAFVHFGLSLLMRQVHNGMPVKEAVKEAKTYLENEFPGYRNAGRTLLWNLTHRNAQLKLYLGRVVFCAGLMKPFLTAYDFLSHAAGKEIRW